MIESCHNNGRYMFQLSHVMFKYTFFFLHRKSARNNCFHPSKKITTTTIIWFEGNNILLFVKYTTKKTEIKSYLFDHLSLWMADDRTHMKNLHVSLVCAKELVPLSNLFGKHVFQPILLPVYMRTFKEIERVFDSP